MRASRRIFFSIGFVAFVSAAVLLPATAWSAVWYVDADNSGTHDGTSWATAFADIQSAVTAASGDSGGDVWVAEGTYTSTAAAVVTMAANVNLYGGFAGTEGTDQFDSRNYETHLTIIDGEDARRGVIGAGPATLDGFTITRGFHSNTSGGIDIQNCSPTIANCVFRANAADYGAAMYVYRGGPTVTNCQFLDNLAEQTGPVYCSSGTTATFTECLFAGNYAYITSGALMITGSSSAPATAVTISKCTFATNEAWSDGGAIAAGYYNPAQVTVSDCRFVGNIISGDGGGIFKGEGTLTVVNSLFLGNSSLYGGGLYCWDDGTIVLTNSTFRNNYAHFDGGSVHVGYSALRLTNSILWGGVAGHTQYNETYFSNSSVNVSYSDVSGGVSGVSGTGNIDSNPIFRPAPSGSTTAISFDAAQFKSTITDSTAAFTPDALAGMALMIEDMDEYEPPIGYLIVDNDETTITVWGDATRNSTVTSPREYEVLSWRVRGNSPCLDAGCDTNTAAYGLVTDDIDGDARGYDGLDDGPTGPPAPGDGSDYDMGADEYTGDDPVQPGNPYDIDVDGDVDAVDVQLAINAALGLPIAFDADVNDDSAVNAVDVQLVINAALGLI